jgi:zona occludens toxin
VSIVAYVGFPGSGKSYAAVEHQILPMLKAHRIVVTNIPLKVDLIKKDIPGCDLREFPLGAIAQQPELITEAVPVGAILVLDEVWRLFPAGTKANQVPEPYRMLFAEHRHRVDAAGNSTQIVLVTQDLAQIGTFARMLVDQTFRITKMSTLGIPMSNRYRVDMYPGAVSGPNPPAASRIRQLFGKYDKKVYQYYVSHTQSEAGENATLNESGADKRANIFKKPLLMALPVIAVVVAAIIWFKGGYLLDKYHKKPEAAAVASAGGAPATAPAHVAAPNMFVAALAKAEGAGDWRVVGTLLNAAHPDKSLALLHSEALKQNIEVKLSRCFVLDEQPTRCPYDGFMYSSTGGAVPVFDSKPGILPSARTEDPPVPPTLAQARPFDPYALEVLDEDPVTHAVDFRKARVSRGGIAVANVR